MIQRALPVVAASVVALAGCTSGNSAIEPAIKAANPATVGVLQFAAGTANIAVAGGAQHTGLNIVTTFRQQGGISASLLNQPIFTGPAGFVNVGGTTSKGNTAGVDAGTPNISGYIGGLGSTVNDTLGSSIGVYRSGLQPANSNTNGTTTFTLIGSPLNCNAADFPSGACTAHDGTGAAYTSIFTFGGGPPLFPNTNTGAGQSLAFNPGFTTVDNVTLASGTYSETVNIPNAVGVAGTYHASSTINATQVLPPFARPTFTPDGTGGGTIAVVVPAGVTEAWVTLVNRDSQCYTVNAGAANYFTFRVTGAGAQTVTVPDNLGGAPAGQPGTHTLCASTENASGVGDRYRVYAVGFDYAAFPIADPNNTSETPALPAQADVTTSYYAGGTAP